MNELPKYQTVGSSGMDLMAHIQELIVIPPKEWNRIKWYYCHKDTGGKCDGKWRRHKPSNCEGKAYVFPGKQNQGKETENPKRKYADTNYNQNSDCALKLKKGIEAASVVIKSNEESSSSEE